MRRAVDRQALTNRSVRQDERLAKLAARGVEIVDPRQTYVGDEVDLERIGEGVVLFPGTRLLGSELFVSPGARIGTHGPATLNNAIFGRGCEVASGYVEGAVLLDRASVGPNAHLRPGTLLEEQASTAHSVGLKHTILLAFVTLGSLINFCDCLMAGGTSRRDHSEVGSGFIHFNFTPWGERGDKATPSLIGDVVDGVFLDQPRIFLGGSAGLVGPRRVGYGAVTGAGQVVRKDVDCGQLSLQPLRALTREIAPNQVDQLSPRLERNIAYIAQLTALFAWYRDVRRPRLAAGPARTVVDHALQTLQACLGERRKRVIAFAKERGCELRFEAYNPPACPLNYSVDTTDHIAWVQALGTGERAQLRAWLVEVVAGARTSAVLST